MWELIEIIARKLGKGALEKNALFTKGRRAINSPKRLMRKANKLSNWETTLLESAQKKLETKFKNAPRNFVYKVFGNNVITKSIFYLVDAPKRERLRIKRDKAQLLREWLSAKREHKKAKSDQRKEDIKNRQIVRGLNRQRRLLNQQNKWDIKYQSLIQAEKERLEKLKYANDKRDWYKSLREGEQVDLSSSGLQYGTYFVAINVLIVKFINGGEYTYFGVPPYVWKFMIEAQGKYGHLNSPIGALSYFWAYYLAMYKHVKNPKIRYKSMGKVVKHHKNILVNEVKRKQSLKNHYFSGMRAQESVQGVNTARRVKSLNKAINNYSRSIRTRRRTKN